MADKCMHRLKDGSFCKRWASQGTRFCSHHQGSMAHLSPAEAVELHPLARLTTPEDIFDLLRETLNAARLGRIPISQAYAVGYLTSQWFKAYKELQPRQRETALHRQILPGLMLDETRSEAEQAEAPHPLPVRVDTEAAVLHDMQAEVSHAPLKPPTDYPGWIEQFGRRKGDRAAERTLSEVEGQAPVPPAGPEHSRGVSRPAPSLSTVASEVEGAAPVASRNGTRAKPRAARAPG